MTRRKQKGSFTIEATILIPMMLFILIIALEQGLDFFQQAKERSILEELQSWDAVTLFYNTQKLEELGEEIQDD